MQIAHIFYRTIQFGWQLFRSAGRLDASFGDVLTRKWCQHGFVLCAVCLGVHMMFLRAANVMRLTGQHSTVGLPGVLLFVFVFRLFPPSSDVRSKNTTQLHILSVNLILGPFRFA